MDKTEALRERYHALPDPLLPGFSRADFEIGTASPSETPSIFDSPTASLADSTETAESSQFSVQRMCSGKTLPTTQPPTMQPAKLLVSIAQNQVVLDDLEDMIKMETEAIELALFATFDLLLNSVAMNSHTVDVMRGLESASAYRQRRPRNSAQKRRPGIFGKRNL